MLVATCAALVVVHVAVMVVVPAAVSEGFKTTFGASEPRTATARLELVFKSRSGSIFVNLEVKFYESVNPTMRLARAWGLVLLGCSSSPSTARLLDRYVFSVHACIRRASGAKRIPLCHWAG